MVRYGGEIENGDFNKGKDANVGLFGMYLLLRYKAIGLFKEFWREVPKFDIFKSPQKAIK